MIYPEQMKRDKVSPVLYNFTDNKSQLKSFHSVLVLLGSCLCGWQGMSCDGAVKII